jgi:hypothetical protein
MPFLVKVSIGGALSAHPNGINGMTRRVHYPEWGNEVSMVVLFEVVSFEVEYISEVQLQITKLYSSSIHTLTSTSLHKYLIHHARQGCS